MAAQNYRAVVAYDGTRYSGFQVQVEAPTVQGELETALQRLTQSPVRVNGAGRTDAGVHARGQVISFSAVWRHATEELERALNAVLPPDVAVRELTVAEEGFHARFSALSRTYIYSVYAARVRVPLLDRMAWRVADVLDGEALHSATRLLVGQHDFAAFGRPPCGQNTERMVYRAQWRSSSLSNELLCAAGDIQQLLQFEIEANGFLRGMVRRLVGTLVGVGTGERSVEEFEAILASREMATSAPPAPACGLSLWQVRYEPDSW